MRVPVRIPIGGKQVTVEYPLVVQGDKDEEDLYGDTSSNGRRIRISLTECKSDADLLATVFHEMLHSALAISGVTAVLNPTSEEAVACSLESMLSPLLCLNENAGIKWREIEMPWEK